MNDRAEFHFSKLCHERRERFLRAVAKFHWVYVTAAIDKRWLYGPGFRVPDSFYKFTCSQAFKIAQGHIRNATVVIDSSGNRKFREELKTYLRKRLQEADDEGTKVIAKLKIEDSHRNNLLQLADMVCGAVARDLNNPAEKSRFRRLVVIKEMVPLKIWPKK